MKIMIVEDEENIRDGIRNLVDWNQEGFEEPLLFSSAVEALVFLETETVDVVLTDLYMPVLNGIEFIRMLREQNQVCEVIILTGHERFELAREAIALGGDKHSGVGNDLPCGAKEGGTAGKRQDHQRNGASGTYRRNIRGKIFGCSFL